jgi:hypothetical protein
MAYTADYHVASFCGSVGGNIPRIKSKSLTANFDFSDEVARIDRETVSARISDRRDIGDVLHGYLTSLSAGEGLNYLATPSGKPVNYEDKKRKVTVNLRRGKSLKFSIAVQAKEDLPLEQLLNLDNINRLILTGKPYAVTVRA